LSGRYLLLGALFITAFVKLSAVAPASATA
jgi:hypothetical protein